MPNDGDYELRFDRVPEVEKALDDPKSEVWDGMPVRAQERVVRLLSRLKQAPYTAGKSHVLVGREEDYGGLRTADIPEKGGRGRWRVAYKVCEECRKQEDIAKRWVLDCCKDPSKTSDKTINIIGFLDPH